MFPVVPQERGQVGAVFDPLLQNLQVGQCNGQSVFVVLRKLLHQFVVHAPGLIDTPLMTNYQFLA